MIKYKLPTKGSLKSAKKAHIEGKRFHDFYCTIVLVEDRTTIGSIDLCFKSKDNHKVLETHSWIDPASRGQGLGVDLYLKAIAFAHKHHMKVRSSTTPSLDAQRVWKSKRLRKRYRIREKRRSRYAVTFYVLGPKRK